MRRRPRRPGPCPPKSASQPPQPRPQPPPRGPNPIAITPGISMPPGPQPCILKRISASYEDRLRYILEGWVVKIYLRDRHEKGRPPKRPPSSTARSGSSALGGLGLRGRRLGLGRRLRSVAQVAALGDAGRLAGAAAQIIELGPAHVAAADHLDRIDG